jgi:basic membrane lipoprotein Med (substrate-binding protein (PBP1-ABC) superfamily)
MDKKNWIICSLLVLLFGFTSGTADAAKFKVALLTPGSISDAGWNALAYEGLKRIEKELEAEISHVESKAPSQWEEHFRFYASKGYGLVFGHGFEYQEAAKSVAPDFPDTVFITTSGNTVADNVASIVFELEEVTYLLGVIAGTMSQTGKIGLIGGMNIPPINSTFHALEEGAKSVNPDIKVSSSYVGDWENIGKAKELALSQITEGVDFIFHNADAAGRGVFHAVEESRKAGKDVYAFGSNLDQNDIAPDAILASAAIDTKAFVYVAELVQTGKFEPRVMWMGMSLNETVKLVYNPKLKDRIPEDLRAKVEKIRQDILAGKFKAPRVKF